MNTPVRKKLTVHLLDMSQGESANGLELTVEREIIMSGHRSWQVVATARTLITGRVEPFVLADEHFPAGRYRFIFNVSDYFTAQGIAQPTPRFLEQIQMVIGVGDESVHLPLLFTPWSYSVYRGS